MVGHTKLAAQEGWHREPEKGLGRPRTGPFGPGTLAEIRGHRCDCASLGEASVWATRVRWVSDTAVEGCGSYLTNLRLCVILEEIGRM